MPTYDLMKPTDKTHMKLRTTTMCWTNLGYVLRDLKKRVVTVRFQTRISLTYLRNKLL